MLLSLAIMNVMASVNYAAASMQTGSEDVSTGQTFVFPQIRSASVKPVEKLVESKKVHPCPVLFLGSVLNIFQPG